MSVPIAVVASAAGLPLIRESRVRGNTRYNLPGAFLVVAGLASLVFGFAQAAFCSWCFTSRSCPVIRR
ncbi:hypothetical protein OL239_09050 [Arthrobacter sp. ATA002]|uniref:hypothetical protein n=1 Tax=Arthrobacter sp. ATA002 TaxID=2991715 RepID=UPI0022A72A93|nr:hypothetical protein [Arthrobacter sp. ATA002]WAP53175.1 hypothetical protein OL239_09050 [Arthrobacter sp. ATA002]